MKWEVVFIVLRYKTTVYIYIQNQEIKQIVCIIQKCLQISRWSECERDLVFPKQKFLALGLYPRGWFCWSGKREKGKVKILTGNVYHFLLTLNTKIISFHPKIIYFLLAKKKKIHNKIWKIYINIYNMMLNDHPSWNPVE